MEFWRENLLKAGTETNYDVFAGLVSLDSFNHTCLSVSTSPNAYLFIKVDVKENCLVERSHMQTYNGQSECTVPP